MTYDFEQANVLRRFLRTSAAWKPMSLFYAKTLHHIDRAVFKATKGKKTFAALVTGLPVCMVTTTGAKSGLARTVPLLAIPDGPAFILIASNYGRTFAPAWCANLRKNPKATMVFEGTTRELVAHELTGTERDEQYARGLAIYPGWTVYQARANRVIPVFRLVPAA